MKFYNETSCQKNQMNSVISSPDEKVGIVNIAKDNEGYKYGLVINRSTNYLSKFVPFEEDKICIDENVKNVSCIGAEVIGFADSLVFGDIKNNKVKWIHENIVETISDHSNSFGVPNIGGSLYYHKDYDDSCLVSITILGVVREDRIIDFCSEKVADLISVDESTSDDSSSEVEFKEPMYLLKAKNYNQILLDLLSHENIASRKPLFENYDKQGCAFIETGWSDACVLKPFDSEKYPKEIKSIGIAFGCAQNPRFDKIDPYFGALNAVLEAIRNVVSVGAKPIAITASTQRINDISNICDSLNLPLFTACNTKNSSIPNTMITCLGKLNDAQSAIMSHFKNRDSLLVMVGKRKDECGGSAYYSLRGYLGSKIPKPDLKEFANQIHIINKLINDGLILASHDISDGGIAVALAEMSFENEIGVDINISGDIPDEIKLFSETSGFILEIDRKNIIEVLVLFSQYNIEAEIIGFTTSESNLRMQKSIDLSLSKAKISWIRGLRDKLLL